MALSADGRWLVGANRRSGTVSVIDAEHLRVRDEVAVGRGLSDIVAAPGGGLLATDKDAGELVVIDQRGPELHVRSRLKLGGSPVCVRVADPDLACVACLWQRKLVCVGLDRDHRGSPQLLKTIGLPFAPRLLLPLNRNGQVLAADAFGGRLALVDLSNGELASVRTLPAHNIRGLALADADTVLLAHQILNAHVGTTFENVHWGNVITNNLRTLPVPALLDPKADLLRPNTLDYLGDEGSGAADPGAISAMPNGMVVVALSGVGEVLVRGRLGSRDETRLPVGACPSAIVCSADGSRAYVANTLSDSISVLDLSTRKVTANIPLGPVPPLAAADRGEILFHSGRLAHDGWYSCQSCHTDGHSNGQLNDNLSDGTVGTPKRVLSLLGVRDTAPYAWTGAVPDLESQIHKSVEITMRGPKPSDGQVHDLATYMRTLPPPPAAEPTGPHAERGRRLFAQQGCSRCHAPPTYTTPKAFDIGLADEAGLVRFNPPSLRGVGQAGPYFHDGRAATLEDVFLRFRHELATELSRDEVSDLIRFLRTL